MRHPPDPTWVRTGPAPGRAARRKEYERALAILAALTLPYEAAKIRAADFYDDFGFCIDCAKFYCSTHWQVSTTGGGRCPAGHFKSLDPHWHPDWDEL